MITELDTFIQEATRMDPAFRIYPDVFEFTHGLKETSSRLEDANRQNSEKDPH